MERMKGYNNVILKQKNRGQVLQQLITNNGISRAELADRCGLTKMSISYIINEFLEKDIVIETPMSEEKKPGRKSLITRMSPGARKIIGMLIHRNFISVALCDCQLNVLRADTVRFTECTQEQLLERAFALTDEMMEGVEVVGIGIGSIGPVNRMTGMILNPLEFYGIRDVPIEQIFRERYGIPVYLDYHYNCAAMAEKYFGKGKDYKNFILLNMKFGIGISIVEDGKIYNRLTGISSEFGHIMVEYKGRPCSCGRRGCLGRYMNLGTEEGIWRSVEILTSALSGICDLLIPDALIIRDEEPYLKEEHFAWMEEELNRVTMAREYHHIQVCRSYRSSDLEAAGCAVNVLSHIFSGDVGL